MTPRVQYCATDAAAAAAAATCCPAGFYYCVVISVSHERVFQTPAARLRWTERTETDDNRPY